MAGNHDWAVAGKTPYRETFSRRAREGVEWTKEHLDDEHHDWLAQLPLVVESDAEGFAHVTFVDPEQWKYPQRGQCRKDEPYQDVYESFEVLPQQVGFVGHSHKPGVFLETRPRQVKYVVASRPEFDLRGRRAIVNVGSVGYPRSRSGRGCVVAWDGHTQRVEFLRFKLS